MPAAGIPTSSHGPCRATLIGSLKRSCITIKSTHNPKIAARSRLPARTTAAHDLVAGDQVRRRTVARFLDLAHYATAEIPTIDYQNSHHRAVRRSHNYS